MSPIDVTRLGKIEKACSGEADPPFVSPYLRITTTTSGRGKARTITRTGTLSATNRYIAVQIPVPIDDDETEGIVPLIALSFARSHNKGRSLVRLVSDRALVMSGGKEVASFPRGEITSDFPQLETMVPSGDPVAVIGLNPRLLLNAAEALGLTGDQGFKLSIRDGLSAVTASAFGDDERLALVMPIRIAKSVARAD